MNPVERLFIEHQARLAGMSSCDFLRTKAGLGPRAVGRQSAKQLADMASAAHALLARMNVTSADAFAIPMETKGQSAVVPPETALERKARIARLRALVASKATTVLAKGD